ncbi:MAG: HIT family protein [Candidatus Thorarchaeota archaeon]
MSPDDCIFCKIVKGEIPSSVVFEDEYCIAFMDVFPIREGHTLLVPKQHFTNLLDVDPDIAAHLGKKLAELTQRIHRVYGPIGILNVAANGAEAGQEVPHLHFHAIPRSENDDFRFQFPENYRDEMASRETLDKVASALKNAIN